MPLDNLVLRREYLVECLGTRKIADRHGLHHTTIARHLRKMGIPSNLHQNWGPSGRVWRGMKRWRKKGPVEAMLDE